MISGPNPQLGYFGVQVGAFSVEANAEKLRAQLSARYSSVSVVALQFADGNFYRVRVGRVPTEEAADQLAGAIATRNNSPLSSSGSIIEST